MNINRHDWVTHPGPTIPEWGKPKQLASNNSVSWIPKGYICERRSGTYRVIELCETRPGSRIQSRQIVGIFKSQIEAHRKILKLEKLLKTEATK